MARKEERRVVENSDWDREEGVSAKCEEGGGEETPDGK